MFRDTSFMLVVFIFAFAIGITVLGLMFLFTKVPYKRNDLLTESEKRFYKLIRPYIEHYFDFYIQVRLGSLVKLPSNYFLWKHFTPLGAKCVDFVVCEKDIGRVLLVIELDDKSHKLIRRIRRDKFVNKVLKEASIPIIHIKVKREYDLPVLLDSIKRKLESNQEVVK